MQLLALAVLVRAFAIQNTAFEHFCLLTAAAFPIHALLPMAQRLRFFVLYSLASILLVLGVRDGAAAIGIGLALVGICHLPIRRSARVAMLVAAGLALGAARVGGVSSPFSTATLTIVGSMFMFRLVVYLYDRQTEKEPALPARTLGYFFMAPNVCFPLFPIIDYKRFRRNYYDGEAFSIYQRGVHWMLRGVLHLLAYRYVYFFMTVDPVDVDGLADLVQFALSSFLLYLQISGQFHLVVGFLLLFGFNLPETHHLYYLASSFTDFWRRINIYWKDFMMKIVYYPVYFRIRRLGETKALVLATLVVFAATWVLHAYQWFWLRGTLLLEWNDLLFWAVLAVLVVANSLYETKYGRARSLGGQAASPAQIAARVLGTAGTFIAICLLWSLWSADSLSQWLAMWRTAGGAWLGVLVLVVALLAGSLLLERLPSRPAASRRVPTPRRAPPAAPFWRPVVASGLTIAGVYGLGHPEVYAQMPVRVGRVVESVRFPHLNQRDMEQMERGYYEKLLAHRHNAELWQAYQKKPADWDDLVHMRRTGDFLEWEYPANEAVTFRGVTVTTNRWGMRDKEYELAKPPGSIRIALLGSSHVSGEGVANEDTFGALLEEAMNAKGCGSRSAYEVLNFAVAGRIDPQQVAWLEQRALPFHPDVLLYVAHPRDGRRVARELTDVLVKGYDLPYPQLRSLLERAGVGAEMTTYTMRKRLEPYEDAIVAGAYQRLVEVSRANGIHPVWILLPKTFERFGRDDVAEDLERAEHAGFDVVSLLDVYDGHDPATLAVADWDKHPNAAAHRLVADRLYELLCSGENPLASRLRAVAAR